jgi:hypothetical protein
LHSLRVNQLLCGIRASLASALSVLNDQLDLLSIDPSRCVDLIGCKLNRFLCGLSVDCSIPRQWQDDADFYCAPRCSIPRNTPPHYADYYDYENNGPPYLGRFAHDLYWFIK